MTTTFASKNKKQTRKNIFSKNYVPDSLSKKTKKKKASKN